jgi:hypothetical protein
VYIKKPFPIGSWKTALKNKIVFYFPTLVLSRSGYKGVISAQSSIEKKTVAPHTTYRKELIPYEETIYGEYSGNLLTTIQIYSKERKMSRACINVFSIEDV